MRTQLVDGLLAHLLQDGDSLIVADRGFFRESRVFFVGY